jgi:hypothetical protein
VNIRAPDDSALGRGRVIALRTTHGDDALARSDAIIDNLAALFASGGKRAC